MPPMAAARKPRTTNDPSDPPLNRCPRMRNLLTPLGLLKATLPLRPRRPLTHHTVFHEVDPAADSLRFIVVVTGIDRAPQCQRDGADLLGPGHDFRLLRR